MYYKYSDALPDAHTRETTAIVLNFRSGEQVGTALQSTTSIFSCSEVYHRSAAAAMPGTVPGFEQYYITANNNIKRRPQ